MGLDVSFSREKAVAAGFVIFKDRNGTADDIAQERASDSPNMEFITWLEEEDEFALVPGTEYQVRISGDDTIFMRANKWGMVYEPLTTWLKTNNIEWDET